MSLRVWLPLCGTLDNYGLDNVTVTNNGATVNNNGKIGSCYSFDGSDDYISLLSPELNTLLTGGNKVFSITMWVYQADSTKAILFGDFGLSGAAGFNIELSADHKVRFYWNGSPDTYFSNAITVSSWQHIAVTSNGSNLKFYLDGELKQTVSSTLSTLSVKASSSLWYLGRDSRTGTTVLNGRLNDFRVYDHCLSPKEVKEISKALALHYPLTDSYQISEKTVIDCGIANIYDGTITGTITINTDTPRNSNSYVFNGSSYIQTTSYPKITDAISVSWWGYMSSWGSYARACSCTEDGGWNFKPNSSYMSVPVYQSGVGYIRAIDTVLLSSLSSGWHHWAMTFDSKDLKLYRDGVLVNTYSSSTTAGIQYTNTPLMIGCESPSGSNFNGKLSDFRIYATALSADDILELYHTPGIIDNAGNMYGYEYIEEG